MTTLDEITQPGRPICYGILMPKEHVPDGVPYVKVKHIRDGRVYVDEIHRTTPEIHAKYRRSTLATGDLLVTIRGTYGRTALTPPMLNGGNVTQDTARVAVVASVDPRFVQFAIETPDVEHYFSRVARGVAVKGVNIADLRTTPIPLPPHPEQRRIVEALETHFTRLDAAVTTLERVRAKLKRYRAAVLRQAVQGRLVALESTRPGRFEDAATALRRVRSDAPIGVEGPPDWSLPDGWCWTTVESVGDVLLGRQRAPQYLTGKFNHPYLRVANVKDDRLDLSDLNEMDFEPAHFNKYALQAGDILVSEGQSPELVGQSAIYRGGIEGLCFQKTLHRFRPFDGGASSEFAQLVFRAYLRNGVFQKAASQTVNIAHLTLERFKALPFPLPPAPEQSRIVAALAAVESEIDAADRWAAHGLARCTSLRQSLLRAAFDGRLAPQDPCDEPASVLLDRIRRERAAESYAPNKRPARSRR